MMAIAISAFMALYLCVLTYTLVAHFRGDHKLCKSLTAFLIVGSPAAIYSFTYPTDPAIAFIQEPLRFFTFVALHVAPIAGVVALYNLLEDGSSTSHVKKESKGSVRPRRISYMVDDSDESDGISPSVSTSVETAAYTQRVLHAEQNWLSHVAEKSTFEWKRSDIACMNVDGQAADTAGTLKSSKTSAETESTEIENKDPASSALRSITQVESTGEQTRAQRHHALYTLSQKSLAASWRLASAAAQQDSGLYKAGQSAATSVSSKPRLDKKSGGNGEIARIQQDCSKILTIPMTTTTGSCLSASVSTNTSQTSAAVEKMHVGEQTGQKAQFSDQKSFEKVMRWLSRQRRLKQFGKGRPYIRRVRNVVRDRYYTLEICRLVARIMKQGFKHEGKTYQHNRFHLLASDLDIVWRISKDADPPPMTERQRRRLMKMKLIEMRTDLKTGKIRPFPTERCMAVKQAIYIAAMTIIEKQLQRQGKRQLNEHEAN